MSRQKDFKKATCKRLMYSMINYLARLIKYEFDVSSYLLNQHLDDISDVKFSGRKICKFIARNNSNKSDNRLCLAISIHDSEFEDISQSHNLLKELLQVIKKDFWQSEILDILESYNPETTVKILSRENHATLVDYIIIIFNLPYRSSIEIIISTRRLSKKIIRRDEEGEVIDYNNKLYSDIKRFEQERKEREISNVHEDA